MPSVRHVKQLLPSKPLPLPSIALRAVTSKSGKGVYASTAVLFKGAVFGRDSVEVAEDLLRLRPRLAKQIILTLASLQGEVTNGLNEEEPGKIVHEYRAMVVDGKSLDGVSLHIFEELARRWGSSGDYLAYYGSTDVTPHYIRLVGRYCEQYGDDILRHKVRLRSGHQITLKLVVENAIDWLLTQLKSSRSGLLEYQRHNPRSIENQVWKDSREFYIHENGELANHGAPIASIEVQGLAYDALCSAARLLPNKEGIYVEVAEKLRQRTFELLWEEHRHYFSLGVDYSPGGKQRHIRTLTANPAALLDTSIFDGLPKLDRQRYISGITRMITSKEFLTDAGIRSRALSAGHLVDYWDYHGSFVAWPKEAHDIAKGLRRQGFPRLARELDNRILNTARRSRSYVEFVYVDEWGRIMASGASADHGNLFLIDSMNKPEAMQAWTISAVMSILAYKVARRLGRIQPVVQAKWQRVLENEILTSMPHTPLYFDIRTLKARYPHYAYKVVKNKSKVSTDFPAR